MIDFKEAKLVKVEVFNDGDSWSMQWKGGNFVHRGDIDSFAKLLQKIKASDDHEDPRSYRDLTYKNIALEIQNGSDRFIWVWEHLIKKLFENKKFRDSKITEGIFQAVSEIDLTDATDEDILRIAIAAEQSAINLYNKLSRIANNSTLKTVLKEVAFEEKTHIGEFQCLLEKIDEQETEALYKGFEEVEELITIPEDIRIGDIILEADTKIKLLDKNQPSPFDIPEISIKKKDKVEVRQFYTDTSGDFRIKIANPRNNKFIWFIYDDKEEAIDTGWKIS